GLRLILGRRGRLSDVAQAFFEPFEKVAQTVDRGGAERFGDLGAIHIDLRAERFGHLGAVDFQTAAEMMLFGSRSLALPARASARGADRCGGDLAHRRARAELERLVGGLARLLRYLHACDPLWNLDILGHDGSPRVLI